MMRPISLEIITKVMTAFDHCRHCQVIFGEAGIDQKFHQKDMNEYPLDLREEFIKLSDWIRELTRLYKHRLLIKIIDVQSLLGIYKSLRYWIRAYPTFIVEGKETYTGWDKNQLEGLLDKYMKASLLSQHRSTKPSLP
jgi:histone acetyltransferase (RNA polymerase elongator complex component)